MISKTLSTSVCYARLFDVIPDLAEFAQSLYPLLVAHADDFGREQGDVMTVKYRIHPRSPRPEGDFAKAMRALSTVGLIVWYERAGRRCYQIAKFDEHQVGLHKRTRSHFPAAPQLSGNFPETSGQENLTELNGTELEKIQIKSGSSEPDGSAPANAICRFDTVGPIRIWWATESHVAEWSLSYPNLDVRAEVLKAVAWSRANPSKRKTAKGMPRFIVSWLNRATDRHGAPSHTSSRESATAQGLRAVREAS